MTATAGPLPVAASAVVAHTGRRPRRVERARPGTAARLAGLHAVVILAVLVATVAALMRTTALGVEGVATRQLDAEMRAFASAASGHTTAPTLLRFAARYLRSYAVPGNDLIAVGVPGSGTVANAGGSRLLAAPAVLDRLAAVPARTSVRTARIAGRDVEILAAPVWLAGRPIGEFVATVDLSSLQPASSAALRLSLAEGAVALVAGVASAYLLMRRLLRRVGRITEAAERIGRGRLAERLGDQGSTDEVGLLAGSFDSMLDRIESAVAAQHELLSDVSHQLRTPLTVARGHLEVLGRTGVADPAAVRDGIDIAIDELDRMNALIERLLVLGRAREPVRHDLHPVDLRAFVGDVFRDVQVLAERRWTLSPVPDLVTVFEEGEIRGGLLNLVDNAVRATRPGDTIGLSATMEPGVVVLAVDDAGPGIPEADRGVVLDRFARPGRRPGGTGLGLAIVRAVCEAHGGSVRIGSSPLGGARVAMVIPLATDPDGPCTS